MISRSTSIREYAQGILNTYVRNNVAQDEIDSLLYMMVGAGRISLLNKLIDSMSDFLAVDTPNRKPEGSRYEAVVGMYGSGKSHIGYMLKHEALNCGQEVIVSHAQITSDARFPATLAALLRSVQIAGVPSIKEQEIEISGYLKMVEWIGGGRQGVQGYISQFVGNTPRAIANDLAYSMNALRDGNSEYLQLFIQKWVAETDSKTALAAFEMVFRIFKALSSDRLLLIIDEFEGYDNLSEGDLKQNLQMLLTLHDDFKESARRGLPALHMITFSTPLFMNRAELATPALCGLGDRLKRSQELPDVDIVDVSGLIHKYICLLQVVEREARIVDVNSYNNMTRQVWEYICLEGKAWHMRTLHNSCYQAALRILGIRA